MAVKIIEEQLRGETIRLSKSEHVHFIVDSHLSGCTIEFDTGAKYIVLKDVTFEGCTLNASRDQVQADFLSSRFEECTFSGVYRHCEFGFRSEVESKVASNLQRCSFAKSTLDSTTFFGTDLGSVEFPEWPHIVIVDPLKNLASWSRIDLPPEARMDLEYIDSPDWPAGREIRAHVFYLPTQYPEGDPEDIWALVQNEPYVRFPGKKGKPRISDSGVRTIRMRNRTKREEKERERLLLSPWNLLSYSRVVAVRMHNGRCEMDMDTSFLRKNVDEAPSQVSIAFDCEPTVFEEMVQFIEATGPGKFILRAADLEADAISLRGQRKALGCLRVPRQPTSLSSNGRSLALEDFAEYVDRYWRASFLGA